MAGAAQLAHVCVVEIQISDHHAVGEHRQVRTCLDAAEQNRCALPDGDVARQLHRNFARSSGVTAKRATKSVDQRALGQPYDVFGDILVLEPHRIAGKILAQRRLIAASAQRTFSLLSECWKCRYAYRQASDCELPQETTASGTRCGIGSSICHPQSRPRTTFNPRRVRQPQHSLSPSRPRICSVWKPLTDIRMLSCPPSQPLEGIPCASSLCSPSPHPCSVSTSRPPTPNASSSLLRAQTPIPAPSLHPAAPSSAPIMLSRRAAKSMCLIRPGMEPS